MAEMRGRVLKGGKPAPNVRVSIHSVGLLGGGQIAEYTSRSDGGFSFAVPDSYTQVRVYIAGRDRGTVYVSQSPHVFDM
ncbi:MAG: hypothetical protein HYU66_03550 [Armatimonadetes bacterium]|nr:hypothetical protein [Armatimonadota bacterium]